MQEKIDYFFHESFLNKDEIKHLNTYIESNYVDVERSTHQALNKEGESKKKTKTLIINYGQIKDKLKNIQSLINHANQNYFGYKIYPQNDFDKCLYNIYESKNKGEYDWHTDSSRSNIYDMKLTILINLSNQNFEGGDFNIFNGTEYTVNNLRFPGTIVIFKSFLNHRVLPITKGQRKSLTLFCNGPMLR
jgi:predicted 2-oxoglutarate/Fe(II)-dependent dioxygenase YbiX